MKNLISKGEKDQIDLICKDYQIENYSINSNGSVDVDGDVFISSKKLIQLPLKFGKVSGHFICSFNQITSLEGSPHTVGGDFYCHFNQITSLEGAPHTVGGDFDCGDNDLSTLVGGPHTVGGQFDCIENRLTSLEGSPISVGGDFNCNFNILTTMVGLPITISGNFNCSANKLTSTYSGDIDIEVDSEDSELEFGDNRLPHQLMANIHHIKLILKYQRHFEIWNDDLSLNIDNFNDLILEIDDGLE